MSVERPLDKQVALVTGGSRGIGLAIARRLGQMGVRVAVSATNRRRVEDAAGKLRGERVEALGFVADVRQANEVESVVRQVNDALGEIDILVNNAGVGEFRPIQEHSEEEWDNVIDTNLKGVFLCTRAVAPQMIRREKGHVVNIGSLAGKNTFAGGAIYCASKWGLRGLSGAMAEDLRKWGIRVSLICPGTVHTEFSPHAGKDPEKMLRPEDVAHAVAMLLTQAPGSFISEVDIRPTWKP